MKVINSIHNYYDQQLGSINVLKETVRTYVNSFDEEKWHYSGRIKDKESFALKVESGRFHPSEIEDFFACTIVVENYEQINRAIEKIKLFCTIIYRKPPSEIQTKKSSESFLFDDLRLYVKLTPTNNLPPTDPINSLSNILFEIQIKTFLQHAWTIATHDLVYKGDDISWAKQRVAYQIKAMLEHAEVSIHEIERIKESTMLTKTYDRIVRINEIVSFLKRNWETISLPTDLLRISETIYYLLYELDISIEQLQRYLEAETALDRGTKILNLSPYFIILQTIINQNPSVIQHFFSNNRSRFKIVIPPEIEMGDLSINESKVIRI